MTQDQDNRRARSEIAAVFARLADAHRAHDADGLAELFTPDAMIADLAPPLRRKGMDVAAVRAWFATWDGPVMIDDRDVAIDVEGDIAFAVGLSRMQGSQGGVTQDIWYRTTRCLKRQGQGWLIVHEHTSVPFHMDGSLRAAVELRP